MYSDMLANKAAVGELEPRVHVAGLGGMAAGRPEEAAGGGRADNSPDWTIRHWDRWYGRSIWVVTPILWNP